MTSRQIKTGVHLKDKGSGKVWEVLARNYDEIIAKCVDCKQQYVFYYSKIKEKYEILTYGTH